MSKEEEYELPEEPVAEEPVAEEPVAEEPVAEEPVAEEPVAEEPVAAEPVAAEPVAAEVVAAAPTAESGFMQFVHKMFPPNAKLGNMHVIFNVIAIVIAMICGFSILFAPIVSLDLGEMISAAMNAVDKRTDDGEGNGGSEESMFAFLGSAVKGVAENLKGKKLTINAMTLWAAGNSEKPLSALGVKLFEENKKVIEEMAVTVTVGTLVSVGAEGYISNLPEEEQAAAREKLADINYDRLTDSMVALGSSTPATKDQAIDGVITAFTGELEPIIGTLEAEERANLRTQLSEMYDLGVTEDGRFDMEQMICTSVAQMMGENVDETITNYTELLNFLMNNAMNGDSPSNGFPSDGSDPFDSGMQEGDTGIATLSGEMLFDPKDLENMMSDMDHMLSIGFKAGAMFFFVSAGIWFLLALLAFIHIFTPKKKFATWYVAAFGGFPATIWLMLTIMGSLFGSIMEDAGIGGFGDLFGAISSGMWICGLCWLAIVVMNFVMGPYRKKMSVEAAVNERLQQM